MVDVSKTYPDAIGKDLAILEESNSPLSIDQAIQAFQQHRFNQSDQPIISLGLGATPIWIAIEVINSTHIMARRRLSIENSWLDKLDVYFIPHEAEVNSYHAGDKFPFAKRIIEQRFFDFDHLFKPGTTLVFIRVESIDPMVFPLYFSDIESIQQQRSLESYGYGFLYGIIFALLIYNLILFLVLKNSSYLLYSTYLASFLLLNLSYTGHGFQWLWPEYPNWQQPSNPLLMIIYAVCGLAFACKFLAIKATSPSLYRFIFYGCALFIILAGITALARQQLLMLLLAFSFVLIFSCMMAILGALSLRKGNQSAKFFLLAAISVILGSATTALAVWGFIPFNIFSFHALEIGMVLDAILLAVALAKKIQLSDQEKYYALKMASTDSLTELNNRRAFYQLITPLWDAGLRHHREAALIMLDIDHFKRLNDSYGHEHGDRVLVLTAQTLKQEARTSDIVARWGGEEFLIFLPETKLYDAINIAERIRQRIANLIIDAGGIETPVTVSLGVAHSTDINQLSLEKLISMSDQHLYNAKSKGRNCVYPHL